MRIAIFALVALFALPALAQTRPPATPPTVLAGAASMTPEQAKAAYRQLDPAQKQQVTQMAEQAKARMAADPLLADPLLKEKAKAWLKARGGSP